MQVTRIIAIRHGETAWNADMRIQGHTDIPLSTIGERQAALLARSLKTRERIDAIFSSDLSRALQTATAVAQATGAPLHAHTGLRERRFGSFEGQTFKEIESRWPDAAKQWRTRTPDWAPPDGGESLLAVRERVHTTLNALARQHSGQQIALFTHGGVLDAMYRLATGQAVQAPRTWQLANTAVNRLLWTPDTLTLVGWNDQLHLEQMNQDHNPTDDAST